MSGWPFEDSADFAAPADYVRLDTVTRTTLRWLWPGRIPYGKVTIIEGDPERAKSLLTLDLAARESTGAAMPGAPKDATREPAGVVLVCAEDDVADTIIPRLDAHGADRARIVTVALTRNERGQLIPLSLPEDLAKLERAIAAVGAKLVVIDPITAYLSETIHSHNDASVRRATTPLADLAQRTGAAIVLVRHLNKSGELKAKYRGGGSIAFTGAARSVLVVEEHPERPGLLVLARVKNNLAGPVPAIGYRVVFEPLYDCPLIDWRGELDIDVEALLHGGDARRNAEARKEAEKLLREVLADGPAPAGEVKQSLTEAGISDSTVKRAKQRLGVTSERQRNAQGRTIGWIWWPPRHDEQSSGEP